MAVKKKYEDNVLAFTWTFVKKYKAIFWLLLITSILAALDETITPLMFDLVIKNVEGFVSNLTTYDQLKWSFYRMVIFWVSFDMLYRISGIISAYLYPLIEGDVRMYMFNEVQNYKPSYFSGDAKEGTVENGVADTADGVHEIIEFFVSTFLPSTIAILSSITLIFLRNKFTGILIFSWALFHILITIFLLRKSLVASSNFQHAGNNLAAKLIDSLFNRNITIQNNNQEKETAYINKYQQEEIKAHRDLLWTNEKIKYILSFFIILVSILLNYNILQLLSKQLIHISDLVFLYMSTFNIVRTIWMIGTQLGPFIEALGQCNKGISILDDDKKLNNNDNGQIFNPKDLSIEFRNVTLYEGDKCLLDNISFFIKSGEKVAILGQSGSGKTTILRTILGLTNNYDGDIFVGNINIKHIDMKTLRDYIGILDQKSYVFNRTIKENILITNPNATMDDIKKAAERAEIYDFIQELPEQFETEVNINKFSGGQVQKICFARFFLKNANILFFDEMSTGLDIIAQKKISTYIKNLENKTCIFVDHNLIYREIFDKIIIIENGKVIHIGTHDELLESSPIYHKMITLFK